MLTTIDIPAIITREIISAGHTAVSVFPDRSYGLGPTGLATRVVFCEGGSVYRLFYISKDPNRSAKTQRIQFTDQANGGGIKEVVVHDIGQYPTWPQTSDSRSYHDALFCVGQSCIEVVQLDPSLQCQPFPRQLLIGGTPNRVIFCEHIKRLIVAISRIVTEPSTSPNSTQLQRLSYPGLELLDPDNPGSTIDRDRTVFGKSGERILGITEWRVKHMGRTWLMLLVPTIRIRKARHPSSGNFNEGRVHLFNVEINSASKPTLVWKTNVSCAHAAYSVAVYDDKSFVYGCGKDLCFQRLADNQSESSFVWDVVTTCNVGSPVKNITINTPFIYTTTAQDSVIVLRMENDRPTKIYTDTSARKGLHHLLLEDHSLVIGTNSDRHLCGLWQPPHPTASGSLRIMFTAQLPESITRLRRVPQAQVDAAHKHTLATMIGSAFDGAFYELNVVNEQQWMLLRFIQNIAARSPAICPYTYRDTPYQHLVPSFEKYHNKHIDGDILLRILQHETSDSLSLLRAMVNAPILEE